ncbi:MAG: prepilin-type N-terminal cleavage/methylation domain-containing protein [Lachnospiraceae bacterium]|nr:prepilin-type N-terminal cleavage/methylation domain-containing protein [Lachnospiraceae bacterium]MEE3461865.1 prepilin-type N-terminal cleavage/methylation domain-containing protein [Lachnospiraceae bacterium]
MNNLKASADKGFTLVELIIAMAMFAFVSMAVMIFMSTGSTNFKRGKDEVDLQMETQLLANQLTSFIEESNNAVYDKDNDTLTLYKVSVAYEKQKDANGKDTGVILRHNYATERAVIAYDTAEKKMYYKIYKMNSSPDIFNSMDADAYDDNAYDPGKTADNYDKGDVCTKANLLAEHVDNFAADTSQSEAKAVGGTGQVKISFELSHNLSKFTTGKKHGDSDVNKSLTVKLRNGIYPTSGVTTVSAVN